MGSVMCWNDNGVERETLILDMKYHNIRKCWVLTPLQDVSKITSYTSVPFTHRPYSYCILNAVDSTPSSYNGQTDAVLDAKFNWRDEHTSKENTDALMNTYPSYTYSYSDLSFVFCRSITVDGVGCDLPNMQTLVRIFCDRATIHSLDATDTNDYWSSWFNKNSDGVWSSSEYSSDYAWYVYFYGVVQTWNKSEKKYCVPTLDLF
jgi:hypothetical protein